jgi:hypothetical protein
MISTVFHSVEFNGDTRILFTKIDTWKQTTFSFLLLTDLLTGEEEKPPVMLITHTHTSESLRNSLVDKTTPKLIIHLVLDFHFFSAKIKLSIAKKWRHTSMTHSPPSKTKKIVMGEWRTAQPIGWSDQRRLRKFFGPIVFFLLSPAEPETKWWPG